MPFQFQLVDASPEVQQAFDLIARVLIDTGGGQLAIRVGTGTITWPGGFPDNQTNNAVTHGLGRRAKVAGVFAGSGAFWAPVRRQDLDTATQFFFNARTFDGTNPANGTVGNYGWIAVG